MSDLLERSARHLIDNPPSEGLSARGIRERVATRRRRRSAVAGIGCAAVAVAGLGFIANNRATPGTASIETLPTAAGAPNTPDAANDELSVGEPAFGQWTPVIEQPVLTTDIDAIATSNNAADWLDRALFPLRTPDGFTVESVSQGAGGDMTEQGGIDTGDVSVQYISTTPTRAVNSPRIGIETMPTGSVDFQSDTKPETVVTGTDLQWDVYVEEGPDGVSHATAYTRTQGPGAEVTYTATGSASETLAQTKALLNSLRLVRVDQIPTEVVDLNRLPLVATVDEGDAASGYVRAAHTTNSWCVDTLIAKTGATGCGFRIDPAVTSAVFVHLSWSGQEVTVAGMAAPGVASIEIDLTDGTTLTLEPTFAADAYDGIGFWAASHRNDGPIPTDGPVVATRAIDAAGNTVGAVDGP